MNIVFVHGIGWTDNSANKEKFGDDLVQALLVHFNVSESRIEKRYSCRENTGLTIESGVLGSDAPSYVTDDPATVIHTSKLGCVDRVVIPVAAGHTVTVYRFLWDNDFYDEVEFRHLGYDDSIEESGRQSVASLRSEINREMKDSVVTYGFSDAAMYMGDAGKYMRAGLQGAICLAASDGRILTAGAHRAGVSSLCSVDQSASRSNLVVMSHSLGSRVAYDVLHTDRNDAFARFLEKTLTQAQLEVFMLANQIPLLALGRMEEQPRPSAAQLSIKLKFIAFSEVNDLLTYELVPYYEHLYWLRCSTIGANGNVSYPNCPGDYLTTLPQRREKLKDAETRSSLIAELGFDAVDVRVKFVGRAIPFIDLADPRPAHSDYLKHHSVLDVLFCGVSNGTARKCNPVH